MRQRQSELDQLAVQVVVVTFQGLSSAEAYASETQLPWPILVDEELKLYSAYSMGRGRRWNIYGPRSWLVYGKLMLRGRVPRAPAGDPEQLGGDILVDPKGMVRLHHVGNGPADRPSVDSMLEVVRQHSEC